MKQEFIYPNLEIVQPQFCIARKTMMCNRLISQIFRKHISKHALTTSQLSILFMTFKKGIISQAFLAKALVLEKSTISRNLQRLLEKGYIERSQNSKKVIQMTAKGNLFLESVVPDWQNAMQEVQEMIGKEGEIALNTLLTKLK